ncbi:MAG: sodium:alanine symporter family protein [Firmicutes bacterium]|nr:sodium:alanine symporter family protein [Bacillota bacterium]
MDVIVSINDAINGFVWGAPAIILIMGVGLYLTIRLKGIQFRNWGFMFSRTYAKAFKEARNEAKASGEGEITSFQAAMASVSAVVGSGNIAGVATALATGGPGALFWMIVAAIVGMATKFAEVGLGIMYRKKMPDGSYQGGPMYYVAEGLHAPWLGKIVAVLFLFYSIVISAVVDTNTITEAFGESFGVAPAIMAAVLAILTGIVIFGGITRIGEVCSMLAPFMAGAYLLAGIFIIITHITQVPAAIGQIITYAFNPKAAFGGAAGVTVLTVMRYGMARGIFSNEAGIGSSAVTHASAKVSSPGEQAIWGPLEVFVDTIIICTITGLTIVLSGLWNSGLDGVALTMGAFSKMLPGNFGQYIVLAASALFGFTCLITYYNYMEKGWIYLFGTKGIIIVKVLWVIFIVIGAFSTLGVVWDVADTCNGLIIIPNLIALVLLANKVVKIKDDYYNTELPKYKAEKGKK